MEASAKQKVNLVRGSMDTTQQLRWQKLLCISADGVPSNQSDTFLQAAASAMRLFEIEAGALEGLRHGNVDTVGDFFFSITKSNTSKRSTEKASKRAFLEVCHVFECCHAQISKGSSGKRSG